ncbi:MAG TPA: carbon-nitrogen hydrolase, partial [Niabella sp.]
MTEQINIEIKTLGKDQYDALKETMIASYPSMPESYWQREQINRLINLFPEGQVAIFVNNR